MNDKKKSIIEAAIKCFAQNGYHGTSIQEIADTLGIAKGSLYFYFKSKEDLFLSVFQYHVDHILDQFRSIYEDDTLSPRGKLHKQIVRQYEQFEESRDFIQMLMKSQFERNEEIGKLLYAMRGQSLEWYQTCILDLYGERMRPYAPDAAAMFSAMITEFMHLMLIDSRERDLQQIARFLLERLDDISRGMIAKGQPPILQAEPASDFSAELEALRRLSDPLEQREDLLAALDVLEEELHKPAPRSIILKGMLAYLEGFGLAEMQLHLGKIAARS